MHKIMMQKSGDWQGYYLVDSYGACVGKTCSMCRSFKDLSSFHKSAKRKFGSVSRCKDCTSSYTKEWGSTVLPEGLTRNQHKARSLRDSNVQRTDDEITRDRDRVRASGTKTCKVCREVLPLTDFNSCKSHTDGLQTLCIYCDNQSSSGQYNRLSISGKGTRGAELRREAYARAASRSPDQIAEARQVRHPTGMKTCGHCRNSTPLDLFYNNRTYGDGLDWICVECRKADVKSRDYPHIQEYWNEHGIPLECYVCSVPWGISHHIDHVIPRRLGGGDHFSNLLPMCPEHNLSKWCRPLDVWLLSCLPDRAESVLNRVGSYEVDYVVPDGHYMGIDVSTDEFGMRSCVGL